MRTEALSARTAVPLSATVVTRDGREVRLDMQGSLRRSNLPRDVRRGPRYGPPPGSVGRSSGDRRALTLGGCRDSPARTRGTTRRIVIVLSPHGLQNGENTFQRTALRLRWIFRHRDDDSSPAPGRAHPDPGQRAADVRGDDQDGDLLLEDPLAPLELSITEPPPAPAPRPRPLPGSAASRVRRVRAVPRRRWPRTSGRADAPTSHGAPTSAAAFDPDDTPEHAAHAAQRPGGALRGHRRADRHRLGGRGSPGRSGGAPSSTSTASPAARRWPPSCAAPLPHRCQRPHVGRGAPGPRPARRSCPPIGRDRHLQQRTHHRDDRDARRRPSPRVRTPWRSPAPPLAARPGRRRRDRQRRAEALPPARRPLRQARPAAGARPHLPARRPAGLRRDRDDAGRLGGRRRAAPPRSRAGPPAGRGHRAAAATAPSDAPPSTAEEAADDRAPSRRHAGGGAAAPRAGPPARERRRRRAEASTPACDLIVESLQAGGVLQAFGTGHSRGLRHGDRRPRRWAHRRPTASPCATSCCAAAVTCRCSAAPRSSVTRSSSTSCSTCPRRPGRHLPDRVQLRRQRVDRRRRAAGQGRRPPGDRGHQPRAHQRRRRPSTRAGQRLSEVADVVIDNLAPYGDTTIEVAGGVGVGAVSSITAAFIAQLHHHRRRGADRRSGDDPARLPVRQHSRRRRAQPRPGRPLRRPDPPHRRDAARHRPHFRRNPLHWTLISTSHRASHSRHAKRERVTTT